MNDYTVLLESGTVGEVEASDMDVGDMVRVKLSDENGCPLMENGKVVSVLEER